MSAPLGLYDLLVGRALARLKFGVSQPNVGNHDGKSPESQVLLKQEANFPLMKPCRLDSPHRVGSDQHADVASYHYNSQSDDLSGPQE